MNRYAGIGSRETPPSILTVMTDLAKSLAYQGFTLRSGHADGADMAFEVGADGKAEIYLPWGTFNGNVRPRGEVFPYPSNEAYDMAAQFHPRWGQLSRGARLLHARNCHQVLGPDLDDPVRFVVCWTKGAKRGGGTGQALRLAEHHGILIYDLADPEWLDIAQGIIADTGAPW